MIYIIFNRIQKLHSSYYYGIKLLIIKRHTLLSSSQILPFDSIMMKSNAQSHLSHIFISLFSIWFLALLCVLRNNAVQKCWVVNCSICVVLGSDQSLDIGYYLRCNEKTTAATLGCSDWIF